jgi:ABC-type glycerol-3-phosphate transport system substrate-binding protein
MFNNRRSFLFISFCFITVCLNGCNDKETLEKENTVTDIVFTSKIDNLASVTVGADAEVYGAVWEKDVARFSAEGDLLDEYPGTQNIYGLYFDGGIIYGYQHDETTERINLVSINPHNKDVTVVYDGLPAEEVRSLTVKDGYIAVITVETFENLLYETDDDGYQSFNEQFLIINIKTSALEVITGIEHPISLYKDREGLLYVYAHPDNHYALYSYNIKARKAAQVFTADDIGYLYAFAYEGDFFIYHSAFSGVKAKRVSDGLIYSVADGFPLGFGGCFTYYNGKIIFLDQTARALESGDGYDYYDFPVTFLRTLSPYAGFMVLESSRYGDTRTKLHGSITISAYPSNQLLDIEALRASSGITGMYVPQPTDLDGLYAFLTSIMAGDDKIDVYMLGYGGEWTNALRDQGYYVPLNDSAPIKRYLSRCFDWVSAAASAPNGDTWMLPLSYDMYALWYVPENFAQFNLTPADVSTLDACLRTIEELQPVKGSYITFARAFSYEIDLFYHYEMLYCDYPNGIANFKTDRFRGLFETMWAGWNLSGGLRHPVFERDDDFKTHYYEDEIYEEYDTERMIFKLGYVLNQFDGVRDITEWRALPIPRLSAEIDHNVVTCNIALVNPHGKNKELATAYLEAAAEDMFTTVKQPAFVLKDPASYEGYYDMSQPVYQDIHNLFRDGILWDGFFQYQRADIPMDYQNGKLTLDEAVDEIQRRADLWLNE